MSAAYDQIVVGLGAAGSAALHQLARRGHRVLGLEAAPAVAHDRGSSHGGSRIIRLVYQESPSYIALLRRSYELWRQLEGETGERLLRTTGCLNTSAPGGTGGHGHSCFDGALASAEAHRLPHEVLTGEDMARRFPAFALPPGFKALLDPAGGILSPERAIEAMVAEAQRRGARVKCAAPVVSWEVEPASSNDGGKSCQGPLVHVRTPAGTFTARSVVLTAGAWMPRLVPALAPLLQVERQVVGWFRPGPEHRGLFAADRFPPFLLDDEEAYYYGFPADGAGLVKLGKYHHLGQAGSAETLDRAVRAEDEAALRRCAERYFPALAAAAMERSAVCMFTNTPDGHFLLAPHPAHPSVILGSACSGHGFKFAPVLGEILADLATGGGARHDLALHGIAASRKGHKELLQRCRPEADESRRRAAVPWHDG